MSTEKRDIDNLYLGYWGLYFKATDVHEHLLEVTAGALHHMIDTSKSPMSFVRRLASMQQDGSIKVRVWVTVFRLLREKGLGLTEEQLPPDAVTQTLDGPRPPQDNTRR